MELEVMKLLHNKCKRCNKNIFEEESIKIIQSLKDNMIKEADEFIIEIDNSIDEVKKLYIEFGEHSTISARIELLERMKIMTLKVKEITNTFLKDTNRFKCDECKKICVIEYFYNNLDRTLMYFDTSDNSVSNLIGMLLEPIVERHNDENIDKKMKEIFEVDGHYKKICREFTQMVYNLKKLQKFIIESKICKRVTEDERELILESLNKDFISYNNWLCRQNIMKESDK